MCLQRVYKDRKRKKVLAELPDMVTCWKAVRRRGNQHGTKYTPEFKNGLSLFLVGWNKTEPILKTYYHYPIAFHTFQSERGAKKWQKGYSWLHIVKCKTRKKDIVAIGEQNGCLCIVTKRIWIPKPKKKSA